MDTCVAVSELISDKLDETDPIKDEYILRSLFTWKLKTIKTLNKFKNLLVNMFMQNLKILKPDYMKLKDI